uniref:Uncharacterized protein n=1 Tax=Aplanochytrium stocchinoi TaxID=215587 RepID=A0A7S3PHE1_9STRA
MPGTISTSATTTLLSKDTEWGQKTESETGLVEKAGRKYVSAGVTGKIGDRKFLSAWSVAQTKKQEGGLAITEKAGRKRIQPDSGRLAKSEDKKRTKPVTKPNVSSFVVFNEFVTHDKETDKYDATEVLSMECYQRWLQTRQKRPKMPEESFRRAITAHVRGADGRRPFSAEVETAILKELRKKGCWKCFSRESTIGKLGYKKYGYHEEERMRKEYGCADLVTKKKHNKTKKQSVATKARKSFMKIKESLLESKSEASSPVQKVFANSNTNDNMEKKTADNNTASASTTGILIYPFFQHLQHNNVEISCS